MSKEITNAVKYTERFEKDFQAYLTPDNTFYLNTKGITSTDLSVNIPQYLTTITSPADMTSTSALSVVDYTQDNKVITQKIFKSNAMRVLDFEATFVANDQRKDVVEAMKAWAETTIGNYACYQFAPTTTTLFTSGTATRPSSVIGSTNTVKVAVKADWIAVRTAIAKTNLPGKWFGLIDADMLGDLFAIDDFVKADATGEKMSRLMSGEFVDVLGIKLMVRSPQSGANVAYTTSGSTATISDIYGAVGAAVTISNVHTGGSIFWNENALYANRGMSKLYTEIGNPIYQSDLYSLQYTYGVDKIRKDNVGVIALVEKK